MKAIDVKLKSNGYKIVVGNNILPKIGSLCKKLSLGKDAIIITHPVINRLYGKKVVQSLKASGFSVKLIEVPEGESSKSVRTAFKVMEEVARYDELKRVFVVALGGGVIGDMAGYVAAAYKRGVPYIQVPTTFLAQIDSAIGGKVAIDLPIGKNLVGAFYQPKLVLSDIAVLKSLDKRQIRNGFAEAIKYGIIKDKTFFDYLSHNYQRLVNMDAKILTQVVLKCSEIKADVVVKDEKETTGLRAILNFGHTVGHAIEAAGKYKVYQHGEAIGLGMRIAASISHELGLLSASNVDKINELISKVGLPESIKKKISIKDIFDHMKHDKKFITGQNRFVLASRIGRVELVEGIDWEVIKDSTKEYIQR